MWRRWVGMVVGALLGYMGGAGAATRFMAPFESGVVASAAEPGMSTAARAAIAIGALTAVIGAVAGFKQGQKADSSRRRA